MKELWYEKVLEEGVKAEVLLVLSIEETEINEAGFCCELPGAEISKGGTDGRE